MVGGKHYIENYGISNSTPVKTGNEIQKGNIVFLPLIEPIVTLVTVIYLY
jgi:hypothetical protein